MARVAVIGAGISGLGAAWLVAKNHEVHLFESESRLGGHAHTVSVTEETGRLIPMDTGFLVYNELTYPHLKNFFKALNVETIDSDMSLSVQVESKNLEWSGTSLNSVFGQRKNLINPNFYKMLLEIMRFGREAHDNLNSARRHAWSLKDLLHLKKYSPAFCSDYLLPIGAAIWSTPEIKILEFPAATFLSFFINHKLLQVNDRPVWRTVKNGSIQYVQKAAAAVQHIHLGKPVLSVERLKDKIKVSTEGEDFEFDKVIMATHAPVTAKLLKFQSAQEKEILSAIQYEPNLAVLHRSQSIMPKNKICWASWNVMGHNNLQQPKKVSLSYYLNRLQSLPSQKDYFITLNAQNELPEKIREFNYSHPQFDQAAIRAQRDLPSIQGNGGVYFAGAWSRYGFHEDGLLSAVNVAELMGIKTPWSVT